MANKLCLSPLQKRTFVYLNKHVLRATIYKSRNHFVANLVLIFSDFLLSHLPPPPVIVAIYSVASIGGGNSTIAHRQTGRSWTAHAQVLCDVPCSTFGTHITKPRPWSEPE